MADLISSSAQGVEDIRDPVAKLSVYRPDMSLLASQNEANAALTFTAEEPGRYFITIIDYGGGGTFSLGVVLAAPQGHR